MTPRIGDTKIALLAVMLLIDVVPTLLASESENSPKISLIDLLVNRFGDLSLAERRLVAATELGENADCRDLSDENKKIRGDLLAWLCTNPQAKKQVTYRGLTITGATIVSQVKLESAKVSFPVSFSDCVFDDVTYLTDSTIGDLSINGSILRGIVAWRTHFKGVLDLSQTTVFGQIDLASAKIDAMLACNQSLFVGDQSIPAFIARGANIKGDITFRNSSVYGGADFGHAIVDGNFDCEGSLFSSGNDDIPGFDASDSEVKCNLFLRYLFKAQGGVDLHHVTVGGTLECTRGQFIGNDRQGALNLYSTKIGGEVVLTDACFLGSDKTQGIYAAGLHAKTCLLTNAFTQGGVTLVLAIIDGNLICDGGHFRGNDTVFALEASDSEVKGNVSLSGGFKANSGIDLHGARIDGFLLCRGSSFIDPPYKWNGEQSQDLSVVDLRLAKAGTLANRGDSWPSRKKLLLDGFTYDRIDDTTSPNEKVQLRWIDLQPKDQFHSQPFEQLADVFRKMGLEEDAKAVMIAKNEEHARYVQGQPEWLWYGLVGHIIGYGYSPWRAFGISLGVVLYGWTAFQTGYCRGLITPTEGNEYEIENDEPRPISRDYPKFNAFVYSLETFLPLVKLGIADRWEPNGHRNAYRIEKSWLMTGGCLRGYLWFHMIAGWVLSALWVGAITGLLKT
jgi:hypothetical protein